MYEIRLRTPLRTFEAENAQKIRTSRLGQKNGVLIEKKKCIQSVLNHRGSIHHPLDVRVEVDPHVAVSELADDGGDDGGVAHPGIALHVEVKPLFGVKLAHDGVVPIMDEHVEIRVAVRRWDKR